MAKNRATVSYQYNALCDVCGFKFKNTQLKKRWDGFMVCEDDFELRHPQDFYTTKNDTHLLPWTRPNSDGVNVGPPVNPITSPTWGIHAVAGEAVAGRAISGRGL